jgi:LPXTG-motif cell wall-anchored protein
MKAKFLATSTLVLLVVGLFAVPALAQEDAAGDPPGSVAVDPAIDEYADVLPRVIERQPAPPVSAVPGAPEVEVLGVTQERLAVTGSDLFGFALVGLLLVGLGFLAIRRGRSVTEAG